MQRSIKFHADENVDKVIIEALRGRFIDVTSTPQSKMMGTKDEDQLARATKENRMRITRDSDFLILGAKNFDQAGIAFLHHELSIGESIKRLLFIYENRSADDVHGQIVYVKTLKMDA